MNDARSGEPPQRADGLMVIAELGVVVVFDDEPRRCAAPTRAGPAGELR
jgi:hypothetical protein